MFPKILDKNSQHSNSTQEHTNIREICARAPILNFSNLRCIWNLTIVCTVMTDNHYFRCTKRGFMSRECTATILHALYNAVQSLEMFPDEPMNTGVFRNHLIQTVVQDISGGRTTNWDIVDVQDGSIQNFQLKDVGDIFMKYGDGV